MWSLFFLIAPAGAGGRFFGKKLRKKLLICALLEVCANMAVLNWVQYVRSHFTKGADQKFLRSFFQKATSPAPTGAHLLTTDEVVQVSH